MAVGDFQSLQVKQTKYGETKALDDVVVVTNFLRLPRQSITYTFAQYTQTPSTQQHVTRCK
jgi:hypothetical protein